MKTTLLDQIRKRRMALGLQIQQMPLRAGLTRQQYGKIEAGGNPRLTTLDQIAEGLDASLLLVPKSKLAAVQRILDSEAAHDSDRPYAVQANESSGAEHFIHEADESPWGDL
ncbi:helix-turn-helix transcriptional regulator [Pseudomonas sp. W2-17]|uniref:helix-turn-helix transcriptional regulator n=1 Tax=Pseudomonas sp. W2-17 TaxID=3058039 RepID=UPI0034E0CF81